MTESEWLACTNPQPMLEFLGGKTSKRKLRLFAVACCRRIWHFLTDERSRRAVEVAERYADKGAGEQERKAVFAAAGAVAKPFSPGLGKLFRPLMAATAAEVTASRRHKLAGSAASFAASAASGGATAALQLEGQMQTILLRDIFGDLFRLVVLDASWRPPAVVALAQAACEERSLPAGTLDSARLAVLADVLEDAGCDNADILSHLRGPGPHVRGCWVVDLLLGKQ